MLPQESTAATHAASYACKNSPGFLSALNSRDVAKLEKTYDPMENITDIIIVYEIVAGGIALRQDMSVITADEIRNHFQKLGVNL
jgi:hypothetical protein